jgi:hypothetical protein
MDHANTDEEGQTATGPHRKKAGLLLDRRVVAAFSVALVITIGLSCLAIAGLTEQSHRAAEIRDNWLYATRLLGDLKCQIASKRDPLFASNNDPLCM